MAVMDGQVKKPELSKSLGLQLYQTMTRIRTFEDKIRDLNTAGELEGYIHLAVGQEGVDAGVCANLGRTDALFTSFRNQGQCIARGLEIDAMMAEMFGRSTGTNRGKGGSMHLADHSRYMFGGNGIVGSSPPLALGPALTSKVRGTKEVSVSFFGEGAAQQGTTHEAMNPATIWKLPVIFVCTNNFYAQSTPVTYSRRSGCLQIWVGRGIRDSGAGGDGRRNAVPIAGGFQRASGQADCSFVKLRGLAKTACQLVPPG
jgi:pyruvate dehydrogenase E1 component alpha subunit